MFAIFDCLLSFFFPEDFFSFFPLDFEEGGLVGVVVGVGVSSSIAPILFRVSSVGVVGMAVDDCDSVVGLVVGLAVSGGGEGGLYVLECTNFQNQQKGATV